MWNRLRYTVWAPFYDALLGAVGFTNARRHSIERLGLKDGDRVLIVGAGTGLALDFAAKRGDHRYRRHARDVEAADTPSGSRRQAGRNGRIYQHN
jgi:phosphatidylethanolamine/phosphatidyl-N-methylethanolamine N-methyltransferase